MLFLYTVFPLGFRTLIVGLVLYCVNKPDPEPYIEYLMKAIGCVGFHLEVLELRVWT